MDPETRDAFASAKLRDSINHILARTDVLDTVDIDHTITEQVTTGDFIETLKIHWRRPPVPTE